MNRLVIRELRRRSRISPRRSTGLDAWCARPASSCCSKNDLALNKGCWWTNPSNKRRIPRPMDIYVFTTRRIVILGRSRLWHSIRQAKLVQRARCPFLMTGRWAAILECSWPSKFVMLAQPKLSSSWMSTKRRAQPESTLVLTPIDRRGEVPVRD